MRPYDLTYLQQAIALSFEARTLGNGPFGAVLVDAQGSLLLEVQNSVMADHDCTAHAEANLVRKACALYPPDVLAGCTLYTSTEPCAMCAGAIFWSGIGRVIFAMRERLMGEMAERNPAGFFLNLPCREVFAHGGREIEVIGPLLEEEAQKAHVGFW
jgi:tRNA(Arg) A34 adenosine deaminase TadA